MSIFVRLIYHRQTVHHHQPVMWLRALLAGSVTLSNCPPQQSQCPDGKNKHLLCDAAISWLISILTRCSHIQICMQSDYNQTTSKLQPHYNQREPKFVSPCVSPVWHVALLHDDITLLQVDLQSPPLHQSPCRLQDLRRQGQFFFVLGFFFAIATLWSPRTPLVHFGFLVEPIKLLHQKLPTFSSRCRHWAHGSSCCWSSSSKHGWQKREGLTLAGWDKSWVPLAMRNSWELPQAR